MDLELLTWYEIVHKDDYYFFLGKNIFEQGDSSFLFYQPTVPLSNRKLKILYWKANETDYSDDFVKCEAPVNHLEYGRNLIEFFFIIDGSSNERKYLNT